MKHGSLFSGIGGIDLGFEMAGIETVWNCEIDEWCRNLLKKRFPGATQYDNVETIGKHNLEPVDIISGGFPCQDISVAGKGEGLDGKRSGLWFEMHRIISELRPRFALIENVQLLTKRGGTRVLSDLAEIGYDAEWQIISAASVGARHLRKRLWIVAYPTKNTYSLRFGCEFPTRPREKSNERGNEERQLEGGKTSELPKYVSDTESISRWNNSGEDGGTGKGKSEILQSKDATSIDKTEIRGTSEREVSDTSVQGLERHRGDSSLQARNVTEESIQGGSGREEKVSDSVCRELERHDRDIQVEERDKVRGQHSSKKTFQRTRRGGEDYQVPDSSSIEHTISSTGQSGEESVGGDYFEEEEQTELDLWGEASRCSELPRTFKVPKFQILEDEPDVGRVANGDALVLDRYKDRIQGLGNGVLPQIPYIIGRRLKEIYDYEQS